MEVLSECGSPLLCREVPTELWELASAGLSAPLCQAGWAQGTDRHGDGVSVTEHISAVLPQPAGRHRVCCRGTSHFAGERRAGVRFWGGDLSECCQAALQCVYKAPTPQSPSGASALSCESESSLMTNGSPCQIRCTHWHLIKYLICPLGNALMHLKYN